MLKSKAYYFVGSSLILLLIFVFSVNTFLTAETTEEQVRISIAFVDIQAIFYQHPQKLIAEELLHQEAQRIQRALEEETRELEGSELQEMLIYYQSLLFDFEDYLIQEVLIEIQRVVYKVAQEFNIAVVLERSNVVYGGFDLTEHVIAKIKEEAESEQ